MRKRLTQRLVVERRPRVVELIGEVGERRHVYHGDIPIRFDRGDVARLDVVDHVDLARLEALELHRVVGDRAVADAIEVGPALLVPVALVALDQEVVVLDPLDELEGPGAIAPELGAALLDDLG